MNNSLDALALRIIRRKRQKTKEIQWFCRHSVLEEQRCQNNVISTFSVQCATENMSQIPVFSNLLPRWRNRLWNGFYKRRISRYFYVYQKLQLIIFIYHIAFIFIWKSYYCTIREKVEKCIHYCKHKNWTIKSNSSLLSWAWEQPTKFLPPHWLSWAICLRSAYNLELKMDYTLHVWWIFNIHAAGKPAEFIRFQSVQHSCMPKSISLSS